MELSLLVRKFISWIPFGTMLGVGLSHPSFTGARISIIKSLLLSKPKGADANLSTRIEFRLHKTYRFQTTVPGLVTVTHFYRVI